ncbi:MAG TPA: universal stress protein [Candidatus Acidoferrales bacterium]|nr:universal stress protein [Candidatus Acidoferrales bacterium]
MKVLVASSGTSGEGPDPVIAAASFPWPAGSEIHVLSVAEMAQPVTVGTGPDVFDPEIVQLRTKAEAWRIAASAAAQLRACGILAEGVAAEGAAETAITGYASEWGADIIVVGASDRSLLEKLVLGSVSDGIVKHAPCSVLVVRQG